MRDTSRDLASRGHDKIADLNRKKTFRPVISRGKHLEEVDWNQLPITSSETLVDEDGVFWFIPGYSVIGGGDRVKP